MKRQKQEAVDKEAMGGRISSGLAVSLGGTKWPPPKPKRGSTAIDYDAKICQVLQDFLPTSAP